MGIGTLPKSGDYVPLKAVCDGYSKADESVTKPTGIRVAILLEILARILCRGLDMAASKAVVRDSTLIISVAVYGLRPAGVQYVQLMKVLGILRRLCNL